MAVEVQEGKSNEMQKDELNRSRRLRVLTLNCWGVPYMSKLKQERFHALGQELSRGNYDIVALQEVWDKTDYETLTIVLETVLPYSFYFYGGVYGTGICIFSRYPILNTFVYPFVLSGYAYALSHGDWFGGKAACFALIDHPIMKIRFFAAHLHAEYDRQNDVYLPHRIVQAYHLAKLVNQLTDPEDFVILCGDMNSEPVDPCYRIIKELPQLNDSWLELFPTGDPCGNTCDRSENTFTSVKYAQHKIGGLEDGKRIDYVFYRSLDQRWRCESSCVTMGRVPGKNFSFSDHDGVAATFVFKEISTKVPDPVEDDSRADILTEANALVKKELKKIDDRFYRKLFFVFLLFGFIFLPVAQPAEDDSLFSIKGTVGSFVYICRIFLTMFVCGFVWFLVVVRSYERHVYLGVSREIDLQLTHGQFSRKGS